MEYIPNSCLKKEMLQEMKIKNINDLFIDIPEEIKIEKLNLEKGKTEYEVKNEIKEILKKNKSSDELLSFLGTGIHPTYIPSVVNAILQRSEFYTAYTPYQPEASQGMLQGIFEYQSLMAELTGMEVVNASMYDEATALGEAALMCARITRKKEFLISKALFWEKKSVLQNYVKGAGLIIKEIPFDGNTGKIDLSELKENINDNTCGVYLENPNFFGVLDDNVNVIKEILGKAQFVTGVNPISLGIIKPPADYGADIVISEGQPFGNAPNFGGPLLGIFASTKKNARKMPGRLIGLTTDVNEKKAFCMTLMTREQHIRRDKATSNICTNEGLSAIAAAVYLSILGSEGIKKLAISLASKSKYLATKINELEKFKAPYFDSYHFNEFLLKTEIDTKLIHEELLKKGIQAGLKINGLFKEQENFMLLSVNEFHNKEDLNRLVNELNIIEKNF